MQAKESVEIERGLGAALLGLRDGDGRAHTVIVGFAEWDDNVQTIHGAALEQHDHLLFGGTSGAGDGALQE